MLRLSLWSRLKNVLPRGNKDTDIPFSRQEKALLFILSCIQFSHIMDFMIIMPLGEIFMSYFSISPQQFSLVVSSYTMSAGVCVFIGAFFIDKIDRKSALLVCFTGFVAGTMACTAAPNYQVLLLARVLTGAFGGILSALVLAIVADVFPPERRGKAMGVLIGAFSAAAVLGVPAGYFLAYKINWNAPFMLISLFGTLVVYLIYIGIPSLTGHIVRAAKQPHPLVVFMNIASDGNQRKALILMSLMMLGQFSVIPFIAPYMERNVGFTQEQVTYIYLVGGFLTIFTSPWIGLMSDKYGKPKVFSFFGILICVPILLVTNLIQLPLTICLIITSLFFVAATGRIIPATTMITSVVKPHQRGGFMSVNASVQQFSAGLASFIAGLVITEGKEAGMLENFEVVGWFAVAACLGAVFVGNKLKVVDQTIVSPLQEIAQTEIEPAG